LGGCEQVESDGTILSSPDFLADQTRVEEAATYVGSDVCKPCHATAYASWQVSHHAQSMLEATPDNIRGGFDNVVFEHKDARSVFTRRGQQSSVTTDDGAGQVQTFDVSYTFGVEPLQQYLIGFPDGRYQALNIVADLREGTLADSKWYHLYPHEDFAVNDPLHWSGYLQNWNYMCADCHSTNLQKGFDATTDSYRTTWSEISVGCEACHGPASRHMQWAELPTEQSSLRGFAAKLDGSPNEVEICARCHSRRTILAEGFAPGKQFLDHYRPAFLDEGLYHADGQVSDEVFVYGSFLQSRMYRHGVTCSNCHEAHNAGKDISENSTCLQCHQNSPPQKFPTLTAKAYDTAAHHFHPPDSAGAQCVSCHMPMKVFMGVDQRHDHSFRIPRPDLSVTYGIPNVCNDCHTDQDAQWALEQQRKRYPKAQRDSFAGTLLAGREGQASATTKLARLITDVANTPGIVRATALSLLQFSNRLPKPATDVVNIVVSAGLRDADPLVRIGALMALSSAPVDQRLRKAAPLLEDPLLAVRLEAISVLAATAMLPLTTHQKEKLDAGLAEYKVFAQQHADRPEALSNLGNLLFSFGDLAGARKAFGDALSIDESWLPALLNLADVNRALGSDDKNEALFSAAIESAPNSADARLAFGLWLTRQGRVATALQELQAAMTLAPKNPRLSYVYAIALNSHGAPVEALQVLAAAQTRTPNDYDTLQALVSINFEIKRYAVALEYALTLQRAYPQDRNVVSLIRTMETHIGMPGQVTD